MYFPRPKVISIKILLVNYIFVALAKTDQKSGGILGEV